MGKSDKYTNTYSPCPCGNGRILEHVDSPDNAYSPCDFQYDLSCSSCCHNWVLSNMWLYDKEAYSDKNNLLQELAHCGREIERLGAEAIDQMIEERNFSDHKSEYAFLREVIGLCKEGPIKYKNSRLQGCRPSSACHSVDVSIFCEEIVAMIQYLENSSIKKQLNELILEYAALEDLYQDATRRLNSRSIKSLQRS